VSKLSNELKMLKILMSHRKYSIKELSERLEVSPRMIRIYKEDLEKSGIYVDSYRGVDGGYILYDDEVLPNIKINKYDIELLESLCNLRLTTLQHTKLNELIQKLKYNEIEISKFEESLPEKINSKELLNLINDCCKKKLKIKIIYESLNLEYKERIIHPCSIFLHGDDDWVIAAYCELRNEVRLFNLNRIKNFEILEEKF